MRVLLLGLAALAAALWFPVEVEPRPRPPTPAEIVGDKGDERFIRSTAVR
jgi:hypothetical protein